MMYHNGYVLVIKDSNGKILRETGSSGGKKVYLPFGSEYSLVLKNKTNRKAVVSVEIDGTDVLGLNRIVVDAGDDYELQRFMIDGNLSSGRKFRFVERNHPGVQDPNSSDIGIVRVRFFEVKDNVYITDKYKPQFPHIPRDPWAPVNPWGNLDSPWDHPSTHKRIDIGDGYGSIDINYFSCMDPESSFRSGGGPGATIEGGHSSQSFKHVEVGNVSSDYKEIVIQLCSPVDSDNSITVGDTKNIFCHNCGARNPRSAKYCMSCGHKILRMEKY